MVYVSKFNKPKNHDDSKFVGGIAYSPYKPKKDDEEYNFYNSRLTHNDVDSGVLGSTTYGLTSQDTFPAETTESIDTSALDISSEESPIEQPVFNYTNTFTPKEGFAQGEQMFRQFYEQSGAPMSEYAFWARKAQDESGFRYNIIGRHVDPETKEETTGLGYFQQLDTYKGRSMPIARQYSGVGKKDYLSNPILQIQAAQRMKNDILKQFTAEDWAAAQRKGYQPSAMVAGAWAGGVGGVRRWLHEGYNAVDMHFKNDPDNERAWECSVAGQMELLNGYFKKGGIIKRYNTGGPMSGNGIQLPTYLGMRNESQPYKNWTMTNNWRPPMIPSYVNSKPYAESSVLGFKNAKDVYEYILSLPGSNPAIAAGWTGVFMKESSLDHNKVNDSSGATGIAQLLGDRRNEYNKWLKGRPDTWQNQISWVWEKVNNGVDDWQVYYDALKDKVDRGVKLSEEEASHWNSMKNSKYRNYSFQNYRDKINNMYDPGDIVELMTWTFERPGNKEAHIDQRREYANAVYNQFN